MKILGHRGASADFAENTLPAFLGAIAQGADGVELDTMRCKSGELVVCHDEVLGRLAGVDLAVADADWAALSRLDVGTPLGFPQARMPLLEEVLEALPKSSWVNVELKCDLPDDRGLSAEAARLFKRRGEGPRISVSSFNPGCLLRFAAVAPDYERGLLLDPDRPLEPQLPWLDTAAKGAVHPHFSQCSLEAVTDWKRRGFKVVVWTVDDAMVAQRLAGMGVEAVITNIPAKLRSGLGSRVSGLA
jgi:glycerophosphoryl diester phosphodiesterase